MAKSLICKTRHLKYLRLQPKGQVDGLIAMIAECVPLLQNLEKLIIGAPTTIDSELKIVQPFWYLEEQ